MMRACRTAPDFDVYLRLIWQTGIRYANLPAPLYLYRQHSAAATSSHPDLQAADIVAARREALRRLGIETAEATARRLTAFRTWKKLSWKERQMTRRDHFRVIEAMKAAGWIDSADGPQLRQVAERRLEQTMPRRWQMLLHWWRQRIGSQPA